DPAAAGVAFAKKILAEKRPLKRVRDDDSKLAAAKADPKIFSEAAAAANKRNRGLIAPLACASCVEQTLKGTFDEGMAFERKKFVELMNGDQSKAQRYAFFAEREASKIAGVSAEVKPRKVERVAVIGAGTMGGGISMSFANAGIP